MESNIDINRKYFFIQLDLQPVESLRLFDHMQIAQQSGPVQEWLTKDLLKVLDNDHLLFVFDKVIYNVPKEYNQKQALLKLFDIKEKTEDIPVYKSSDIQDYLCEIDKKDSGCYFLIADKDKRKHGFDKIKELGFDFFHKSENLDTKNRTDVFLVFKNEVYPCSNLIQNKRDGNFSSNTAIKDLLSALCIPESKAIPQYKLKDVLKQQDKDIESVGEYALCSIPVHRRTDKVCMAAARSHHLNIEDIPIYMLTDERIDRLLEMHNTHIYDLPYEKINEDTCLRAVKNDSNFFSVLTEELRTEKVCMAAYNKAREETDDPAYIDSIVSRTKHPSACLQLLKQYKETNDFRYILFAMPAEAFNQHLALEAVKIHSYAIEFIPDNFKSEDLCQKAFAADTNNLQSIPDRYKSKEMCQKAIDESQLNIESQDILRAIPYPDIILNAINNEFKDVPSTELVKWIPKEVMNDEIVTELIKRDPSVLPDIPCHLRTEAICLEVIQGAKSVNPFYHIPQPSMSLRACYRLTTKFPQALGLILPEDKRTAEICLRAIKQDDSLKKYVPQSILKDKYMNIYNFNQMVEKKIDNKLSFDQIKDLYNGKEVSIEYTDSQVKQGEKVNISYNYETNCLDFRFINKSEQLSQLIKQNVSSKKSMEKGTKL